MDRMIRCITSDGAIMAAAVDTTNIVAIAQELHHTSGVATAALGRLLSGASLMGAMLKKEQAALTMKINGGGSLGSVVAIGDSHGNVRGYVEHPEVELPLKPNGKLDVGGGVGRDGLLMVVRDLGEGEPYVGQVRIVTGEIAEDITAYYAISEQIPTVCALGVLVDKEEHRAMLSSGLLIQVLPGADSATIDKLEENIRSLEPVTTMLAKGITMEEIFQKALFGFEMEILDEYQVKYVCTCSRDKVVQAFSTLKREDIVSLADETGYAEASCQYCGKKYRFSVEELEEIAKQASEKK